jgi:hypothetical protein
MAAPGHAAAEFISFCRGRMWVFSDIGTTAAGESLYGFTHRTFLENFAAAQLSYTSDTAERLARTVAPRVARHEWEVVGELSAQIKDRTSDRGAERFYQTLLAERRRAADGHSAKLQFLSRCLRSVDPPPLTVRTLTRQVFDHLLTGDPNDRIRGLPLSWLLGSSTSYRDIVDEEITAWVDARPHRHRHPGGTAHRPPAGGLTSRRNPRKLGRRRPEPVTAEPAKTVLGEARRTEYPGLR